MSGSARRRGRARGQRGESSDASSRPGGRGQRVPPFDGPASRGTGSGAGSQGGRASNAPSSTGPPQGSAPGHSQGSTPGSRRGSVSQTPTQPPQNTQASDRRPSVSQPAAQPPPQSTQAAGRTEGLDPARESKPKSAYDDMRNIDFPASFYNLDYTLPTQFTRRPAFNSTGKPLTLAVNSYRVLQYPQKNIWQYDVHIGDGKEKRAVVRKVWNSQARKQLTGQAALFDGNKLAWSSNDYGGEIRCTVDLDVEEGQESRGRNIFNLIIRKAKKLDLGIIDSYLSGQVQFSMPIAEGINFMDHLLREGPSTNPQMIAVKRSFFVRGGHRQDLGGGIEVFRGVYQSMRLAEGKKMVVNLDVSNTCFWRPGPLLGLITLKNKFRDVQQLKAALRNTDSAKATLRYLNKLTVKAQYKGNKLPNKEWKIAGLSHLTANTCRLDWKNPATGEPTGEMITVNAYFKRKYNLQLQHPDLPLLEMTKKDVKFPMELLVVIENQRYGSKLDELQTANMIKFAVSPPNVRLGAIEEGKNSLNWQNDPYLTNYGLRIDNQQIQTQARILPAPGIIFGNNKVEQPGTRGKWDLRNKQFFTHNEQKLEAWGIGIFGGRVQMDKGALSNFASAFIKQYRSHGGDVGTPPPHIMLLPQDAAQGVSQLWDGTGNHFNRKPQLLIFLVQNRDSMHYLRIKKSCDCRYGVVSQVMQAAQVQKGNPQYYSNVLMKVNAKLRGCTSKSKPAPTSGFKAFPGPTMFIGADVSHASPGSDQASMAAITVSFDRHAGRYVAACQTNGRRVEMITESNMRSMLGPLVQQWTSEVGSGGLPQQVYYMRDGVSEGQFAQVLQQEVPVIRAIMVRIANGRGWNGKITVVIASKRHHIRAFPKQGDGDNKNNPLPGTLIERDVTMPNEWDFYLYSHIALQGTSRPVHYTVIQDEANHTPNVLQNMIYEHCYQYMRSTTAVSLHPAVYYAHLASNRAKAHEDIAATAGPQGGPGYKQNTMQSSETTTSEPAPLMKLNSQNKIQFTMWYI